MPKRYWWVIITYILMQLSSVPVALILRDFTTMSNEAMNMFIIYWTVFSFLAGLVIVLLLMKPDMKTSDTRNKVHPGIALLWAIAGVFMAYFSQAIAVFIELTVFNITPGSENTFQIMDIARAAPFFIIVPALVAPILEEIIFRKIIFGEFYKRTNFFIAAILSAAIFGIIHQEPEHILVYASMGFVFAFLYVQTKRILVPIVVHMTLNSVSVIMQFTLKPEDIEQMQKQFDQLQMIFIGG